VQRCGQGRRGGDRADLPEDAGQLGDHGGSRRREPQCDQLHEADEDHRITHADEDPGRDPGTERADEGERELASGHQQHAGDQQLLRTDPIQDGTDRDLHGRVDEQLNRRECRKLGRADVEPLCGREAGHAQRGAVENGQDVDGHGGRPHHPGSPAAEAVAQRGVGWGRLDVGSRRHRTLPACPRASNRSS
jgi:hypothetical protein